MTSVIEILITITVVCVHLPKDSSLIAGGEGKSAIIYLFIYLLHINETIMAAPVQPAKSPRTFLGAP